MGITRRQFVANSALCASGARLLRLVGIHPAHTQSAEPDSTQSPGTTESIAQLFSSPAADAWPWTYWYCISGNLSREAITADLEAMRKVGIRGAIFMEVELLIPKGPVSYLSQEWRNLMQHATQEATRLGITLDMNNDGGWAGAGGPWITPELSMQMVVWSETAVEGPKTVSVPLPQPKTVRDYYNDVAVLAFPAPPGDNKRIADYSPEITYGADRKELDSSRLLDGNPGTVTLLPLPAAGHSQYLNIDFPEPFTAQSASIGLDTADLGQRFIPASVQVSDDGNSYRTMREMRLYEPHCSVNFPTVSSRHYRILIEPDLVRGAFSKGIPLAEVQLHEGPRIENIPGKALYTRQGGFTLGLDQWSGQPEFPTQTVVRKDQILDLSNKLDDKGVLHWDVPPGKWTVLRVGHTTTGATNEPAPKESVGLECDKLSRAAIETQFQGLIAKLLQDQTAAGATAIKMTHVDSWDAEIGSQNWTLDFRQQFQKRRGYDPLPYLLILTGRAMESGEHSERFLWDFRRTIADLLLENFADRLRELSHEHGLTLSIEGYGAGPLDELAYGGRADVPMGEFWVGHDLSSEISNLFSKAMTSSAHTYGRPVIGAESFTSTPDNDKWLNHPFSLKPLGDLAFTWGINRLVMNFFTMQYWQDRKPGMTTGPWGIHYDRTNTWWEQSLAWNTYLARCQTLLQNGTFVADVAYLGGEGAPYSAPWRKDLDPALPPGYDYDYLSPEILLKDATVQEGRLVLKSGMSYRLLVLQSGRTMTPALLKKLKELVKNGLAIVGPRPVNSPSLADFPRCDAEVKALAEELWGECDGSSIRENRFGAGRVLWGEPLGRVMAELATPPDFDCYGVAVGQDIQFIHRNLHGDDFYFVANGLSEAKNFVCIFRTGTPGKKPELWWPDSGRIEPVCLFTEVAASVALTAEGAVRTSRISIPITLDPYGSVFVVFRANAESRSEAIVSVQHNGAAMYGLTPGLAYPFNVVDVKQAEGKGLIMESAQAGTYNFVTAAGHSLRATVPQLPGPFTLEGLWELSFPKNLGAPQRVILERLISWTEHPDSGVKYFSGTATYRKRFMLPTGMLGPDRRLYLHLGKVCVMAEIKLNGKNLGILWKPPFAVDVTDALAAGNNDLEIQVVNLWPNRLIGDEQLPDDCEWAPASTVPFPKSWGAPLARWPQWLVENKPRPTERVAFTTWKYWGKDDPLFESGLLGPVQIFAKARAALRS